MQASFSVAIELGVVVLAESSGYFFEKSHWNIPTEQIACSWKPLNIKGRALLCSWCLYAVHPVHHR